eukprot:gene10855-12842_t
MQYEMVRLRFSNRVIWTLNIAKASHSTSGAAKRTEGAQIDMVIARSETLRLIKITTVLGINSSRSTVVLSAHHYHNISAVLMMTDSGDDTSNKEVAEPVPEGNGLLNAELREYVVSLLGNDRYDLCKEVARLQLVFHDGSPYLTPLIAECLLKNQCNSRWTALFANVNRPLIAVLNRCADLDRPIFDYTLKLYNGDFDNERLDSTIRAIGMVNGIKFDRFYREEGGNKDLIGELTVSPKVTEHMLRLSVEFADTNIDYERDDQILNLGKFKTLQHLELHGEEVMRVNFKFLLSAAFKATLKRLVVSQLSFHEDDLSQLTGYAKLESLKLHTCDGFTTNGNLSFHSLACKSTLKTLDLSSTSGITDGTIISLQNFCALESLLLFRCENVTSSGFDALVADGVKFKTTLKHLDVSQCTKFTDENLRNVSKCEMLSHLNLNGCTKLTGAAFGDTAGIPHFQSLEQLRFANCLNLERLNIVSWLPHAGNLKELDIDVRNVDDEFFSHLQASKNLERLRIGPYVHPPIAGNITDPAGGLFTGQPFATFSAKNKLRSLDLGKCDALGPSLSFLKDFSALERLTLFNCGRVTAKGMLEGPTKNTLRQFHVYNNKSALPPYFGDEFLSALANFTELSSLVLSHCVGVTLTAFSHFQEFRSGKKIKRLEIINAAHLTDATLVHFKEFSMLETLVLRSCPNLTGGGFEGFDPTNRLSSLDLSRNSEFAEDSVQYLATFTGLRFLNLANCSKVTGENFKHFGISYIPLEYLDLSGTSLTRPEYDSLLTQFPNLNVLHVS